MSCNLCNQIRANLSRDAFVGRLRNFHGQDQRILTNIFGTTLVKGMEHLVTFSIGFTSHLIYKDFYFKNGNGGWHWSALLVVLCCLWFLYSLWDRPEKTGWKGFKPQQNDIKRAIIPASTKKDK